MNYNYKESTYQVIVNEGNLELQSLHETIIYEGAHDKIMKHLQDEYWSEGWYRESGGLGDFISYHEQERIRVWLDYNRDLGVVLKHELN